MEQNNFKWHQSPIDAIVQELKTDAACGLSRKAARSRSRKGGANTLFDAQREEAFGFWKPFFKDPSLIAFFAVCIIAFGFSEVAAALTALAFFAIGFLLLWLLFRQYHRDEAKIAAFRIPTVTVVRDGEMQAVSARRVVVGDVILLRRGDIVPCDCRLIESRHLRVQTLLPDEKGNASWQRLPKNAETLYPYASSVFAPYCENMLYGGSVIDAGYALAIAVEIGENTFIGAMQSFAVPAEDGGKKREKTLAGVKDLLRLYNFAQYLFLIPITIIGVLLLPAEQNLVHVLLALGAMLAVGSQSLLLFYFQTLNMRSKHLCLSAEPREDASVLKTERAVGGLSAVNDVLVLGHCSISDGKAHLFRCATGGGEVLLNKDEPNAALHPLCEAILVKHFAKTRLPEQSVALFESAEDPLIGELLRYSGYDEGALRVRLLHATLIEEDEENYTVRAEGKNGEFYFYFSDRPDWIDRCTVYDDCGTLRTLSAAGKAQLHRFVALAESEGGHCRFAIKKSRATYVFLGALPERESFQEGFSSLLESYRRSGVRVSFFLFGDPAVELPYAKAAKLPREISVKDGEQALLLPNLLESHRVFLGYSENEVLQLVAALRKLGRGVAVISDDSKHLPILQAASLSACCEEALCNQKEGRDETAVSSSLLRRRADVLIPSASQKGGGLSALYQALTLCRAMPLQSVILFRFLCFSQGIRWVLMLLALFTGAGFVSGAMLLFSGWILELLSVLWLSSFAIPKERLQKYKPFGRKQMLNILKDRSWLLPILVSGGICGLLAILMRLIGLWGAGDSAAFLLGALLLMQGTSLLLTAVCSSLPVDRKKLRFPILVYLLPILMFGLLSILLPSVALAMGLPKWNLSSLLMLVIVPFVFFFFVSFFLKKINRTAK
jgi:hypothetical protein